MITDEPVKVVNLMSGDIDITDYLNAATSLDTLKNIITVEVIEPARTTSHCIRTRCWSLGDPRVRIAITHAIDKQAILDALTRGYGRLAPFLLLPVNGSTMTMIRINTILSRQRSCWRKRVSERFLD